jgi:hypothetical protein
LHIFVVRENTSNMVAFENMQKYRKYENIGFLYFHIFGSSENMKI